MAQAAKKTNPITLNVTPVQWADLRCLNEVKPINQDDHACLAEIRDVLSKHGRLDRFGVALLHKHFDMADDEMLMEKSNPQDRVLTIAPVKRETGSKEIQTIWKLTDDEGEQMLQCEQTCIPGHVHDAEHKQG